MLSQLQRIHNAAATLVLELQPRDYQASTQERSQEFHLGGINFNFANFAKAHTGTISNLSWVKEKKTTSNYIKICKVD